MARRVHDSRRIHASAYLLSSVIFGILAWGGLALTAGEGQIAVVWLANAFLVAIILRSAKRHVPFYLAGAFAANIVVYLLAGETVINGITLAAINQFEMILIWFLMQRLALPRPDMQRLSDLGKFCVVGGFLAPLASGFLAGLFFAAGTWQSFLMSWLQWSTTDGLGMILLSPAVMVVIDLFKPGVIEKGKKGSLVFRANRREWLAIQVFTLASAILIFGFLSFPIFFMVAPLILFNAFRLGTLGTSVSIMLIAIVIIICVTLEAGPFYAVDQSLNTKLFILQIFLLSCFTVGMPTSAMLAEKAKIRQSLRAHRDISDSLLENMTEVLFRTDKNLRWQFLNPAWESLTGRSIKDSLGHNVAEIFDIDGFTKVETHLKPIRSGAIKRTRFDGSFHHVDGSKVDVELSFSRLTDDDGAFLGIVGSIRDVTKRKQMEQNLVAARVGAEKAAEAKTLFLANMSHEIRTPMNGVLGFTQLLLDSELPAEQDNHARMILNSGNAMMRLLNNILDISKVEAGQISCTMEPMSTHDMFDNCVALMAPVASEKNLTLNLEIDENVPKQILADADHLRQILLNLLGNAVKFTPAGAITITVEADDPVAEKTELHIFVEDTGIGIPADRLEAIFAPFEQADSDTSRNFGGTGLGLTISRQLASIMQGSIELCSTEGHGTTFHLQFPVGILSDQPADRMIQAEKPVPVQLAPPATEADAKAHIGKILLAEDHDINQILISEMIKKLGYQTVLAVNGEDAVEKITAAARDKAPFDLVLMDVQMPIMDGYEATKSIRSNGYSKEHLPILAVTANAYPEDIESCLQSGMQGHIAKPVMIDNLKSSLQKWLTIH